MLLAATGLVRPGANEGRLIGPDGLSRAALVTTTRGAVLLAAPVALATGVPTVLTARLITHARAAGTGELALIVTILLTGTRLPALLGGAALLLVAHPVKPRLPDPPVWLVPLAPVFPLLPAFPVFEPCC